MRPTTIPAELVWEGSIRRVIAGPGGDLIGDIRAVEAIIDADEHGPRYHLRIVLEAGDLERLAVEPHFWLTWHGNHLHPFALTLPADAT